jgi:hypothetical protein
MGCANSKNADGFVGIKLAGVKELRDKVLSFNDTDPADPITKTAHISIKIVKPATSRLTKGEQAYVHLDGGKHRGKPEYFVSQTWQADAMGLLDSIIRHGDGVIAKGGKPPVYYLDLASVDQHQTDQVSLTSSPCMPQHHLLLLTLLPTFTTSGCGEHCDAVRDAAQRLCRADQDVS